MNILIKIKNGRFSFLTRKRLTDEQKNSLNNLNANNELLFTDDYITNNLTMVTNFLNSIIKNGNITTLSFQTMEVATTFLNILPKLKDIKQIYFESNEVLLYKICEKLTKCPNIKTISAAFIPAYMFEMLDKYGIIPESRDEILFTSNFMQINDLTNYATIFYKYMVYLEFPLSMEDLEDFASFCKINRNLKVIHVNKPNRFNLEEITGELKKNRKRKIKIFIHGDVHDPEVIEYLRKNNKKLKSKYQITMRLKYSDEYIRDNLAKQTNNNILRMCGLLIIAMIVMCLGLVFVDNYKSMKATAKIQTELHDYIIATDPEPIKKEIEEKNEGKPVVNDYIASLTSINSDSVAWLKVNNTNIDYAIMQTTNNSFYLNHNIYKEEDPNGWLFLNSANKPDLEDDNTIIYGHNRFVNGVMFGTLNKALYRNWYTVPENQIISYDTLYGSYKFQIFSIYIVPTTNDYIETNFVDAEAKLKFLDLIKSRSIYDFGLELNENTKVLTLSTCQSDVSRLVVHAALIEE